MHSNRPEIIKYLFLFSSLPFKKLATMKGLREYAISQKKCPAMILVKMIGEKMYINPAENEDKKLNFSFFPRQKELNPLRVTAIISTPLENISPLRNDKGSKLILKISST